MGGQTLAGRLGVDPDLPPRYCGLRRILAIFRRISTRSIPPPGHRVGGGAAVLRRQQRGKLGRGGQPRATGLCLSASFGLMSSIDPGEHARLGDVGRHRVLGLLQLGPKLRYRGLQRANLRECRRGGRPASVKSPCARKSSMTAVEDLVHGVFGDAGASCRSGTCSHRACC